MSTLETCEGILSKLSINLFKNGESALQVLENHFTKLDTQKTRTLSLVEVELCLKRLGIFLNSSQLSKLARKFSISEIKTIPTGEIHLNYQNLLLALQPPLSPDRITIIKKIYNHLEQLTHNNISFDRISSLYKPDKHYNVVQGYLTPKEQENKFILSFGPYASELSSQIISYEEFLKIYTKISACLPIEDPQFISLLENVWGYTIESECQTEQKYFQTIENTLRQKAIEKSQKNAKQSLYKTFLHFDYESDGTLSFNQFLKAMEKYGFFLKSGEYQYIFKHYLASDGEFAYIPFLNHLFPDPS